MEFNTREHLTLPAYEISLPKLELHIVSERDSVLSRYSDIKSREVALASHIFLLIFLRKMRVEFKMKLSTFYGSQAVFHNSCS